MMKQEFQIGTHNLSFFILIEIEQYTFRNYAVITLKRFYDYLFSATIIEESEKENC